WSGCRESGPATCAIERPATRPRRYTAGFPWIADETFSRRRRRAAVPAAQRGLHWRLRWPAPGPPGAAAARRRARARTRPAAGRAGLRAAAARGVRATQAGPVDAAAPQAVRPARAGRRPGRPAALRFGVRRDERRALR